MQQKYLFPSMHQDYWLKKSEGKNQKHLTYNFQKAHKDFEIVYLLLSVLNETLNDSQAIL